MALKTAGLKPWLPAIKWLVRLAILSLVVWGLVRTWDEAQAKFEKHQFSWSTLEWPWLAASCGLYVLGTLPSAWFWHQSLWAMGQRPRGWETFRAYYIGHLGKYVPGKALVVVLRAAMVRSERTDSTIAALGVFVETLTLMAVGAVVAALILVVQRNSDEQDLLTIVAVGLGICAGVPTAPPLFRAVVTRLPYVKSHPAVAPAVRGLKLGLMAQGWVAMTIAWLFMGASLWATLRAMPDILEQPLELSSVWLLTAGIALATVAGFVSFIPGGLGVRELVVAALLIPAFGEGAAIVSAVVMRLVSLVAEVLVSTILYLLVPAPRVAAAAATPAKIP